MANATSGKVWSLDTVSGAVTGIVSTNPVCIHSIQVRFTTAGAGSFQLATYSGIGTANDIILDCVSLATSTANAYLTNQVYTYGDQTFMGLKKILTVNVESIYIVTGIAK